jgi:hypothetical protein
MTRPQPEMRVPRTRHRANDSVPRTPVGPRLGRDVSEGIGGDSRSFDRISADPFRVRV